MKKKFYGKSDFFDLIELSPKWNLATGIYAYSALSTANELRSLLLSKENKAQSIASKAGNQAENIFSLLVGHFPIPIPERLNNRHTLAEYAIYLGKHCSNSKKGITVTRTAASGEDKTDLLPILKSIGNKTCIRNEDGCHFTADDTVPYADILAFGNEVISLTDLLLCPDENCRNFPTKLNGDTLTCPCGKCSVKLA